MTLTRSFLAIAMAFAVAQGASAQSPSADTGCVCKVYALGRFGDDPSLGKWIADTIPSMIAPGSWTTSDGKMKLSYFAPGKVMVINHSADVHRKSMKLLQNVKKSLSAAKMMPREPQIMPAHHAVMDTPRPMPMATGYPVPASVTTPKHLFHFVIRYEGDEIIDSNVVKFTKAMSQGGGVCVERTPVPTGAVESTSGITLPSSNYLKHPPQYLPTTATPPRTMPAADEPTPSSAPPMNTWSLSPGAPTSPPPAYVPAAPPPPPALPAPTTRPPMIVFP